MILSRPVFAAAFERGCSHGVAVIGMENQWLAPTLADPFSQAGRQIHGAPGNRWLEHDGIESLLPGAGSCCTSTW